MQFATTIQQLAAERERADVLQREALGRIEALTARSDAAGSPERRGTGDQGADDIVDGVNDAPAGLWERVRRWLAGEPKEGR